MHTAAEMERRGVELVRHIEDMLTVLSLTRADGQPSVELDRFRFQARIRLTAILNAVDLLPPCQPS